MEREITRFETIYGEHKILQRAQTLKYQILMETDENAIIDLFHTFEKLDKERMECMHTAESFAGSPPVNGKYE